MCVCLCVREREREREREYLAAILDGRHLGRRRGGGLKLAIEMLMLGPIGPAASRAAPALAVVVGVKQDIYI